MAGTRTRRHIFQARTSWDVAWAPRRGPLPEGPLEDCAEALRRFLPKLAYPTVLPVDVVAAPCKAQASLRESTDDACDALGEDRYPLHTLACAWEQLEAGQPEDERAAFAAAVADWRKGSSSMQGSSNRRGDNVEQAPTNS